MAKYFIEVRFGGKIKRRLREIIHEIADRFDARTLVRSHYVPHISLYGSFYTNQEKTVLARIRDTCADYDLVPYRLAGFDHFDGKTVYADVHSFHALRELRYRLSRELGPITSGAKPWDNDRWCKFHTTVARREPHRFEDIWNYVTTREQIEYDGYVERVSLIKNGSILKEYSVPQGRFLNEDAATSSPSWKRDTELIERWQQPGDHDGLVSSQPGRGTRWWTMLSDRISSHDSGTRRWQRFEERSQRTFVIGDLHLNHRNIIDYCDRPFDSLYEMNQKLVANWNDTVAPGDTVILLGDLDLYFGTITTHDWLHALHGDIVFIRGNHDGAESIDYEESYILETDDRDYYCTHYPEEVPADWDGWVIHGHKHNNDLQNYPFIDTMEQRVNASVELIDYQPLSVSRLEQCIESNAGLSKVRQRSHIERMIQ